MNGPYISGLLGAFLVAMGCRWAFWPERVVARNPGFSRNPQTVRRFGYVVIALGSAVVLINLVDTLSE